MKIEICEQMLQSWLINCKQCEVVQTNWMVSALRDIDKGDIDAVKVFMKDVQDQLNVILNDEVKAALQEQVDADGEPLAAEAGTASKKKKSKIRSLNIFKKSKPEQFVRQCEIDVVGVKLDDGITDRVFLVDTAFHKAGLGYKDVVATVVKKIIRALTVAVIIFGESVPVTVAFAAPVCSQSVAADIDLVLNALRSILGAKYANVDIEVYFNQRFAAEIYLPLKNVTGKLNHDNDLFMRAMNLAAVAEKNLPTPAAPAAAAASQAATAAVKRNNQKIVTGALNSVIKAGKMTSALLDELQKPSYAKAAFKMPVYPILAKEAYFGYDPCRFYKTPLTIQGENYLVCSQWTTERLDLLEKWCTSL